MLRAPSLALCRACAWRMGADEACEARLAGRAARRDDEVAREEERPEQRERDAILGEERGELAQEVGVLGAEEVDEEA